MSRALVILSKTFKLNGRGENQIAVCRGVVRIEEISRKFPIYFSVKER